MNLHLGVGPLRADGYHSVITVLQAVSLYDDITATATDGDAEARPAVTISVSGEGSGPGIDGPSSVPADGDNLAVRAAVALAARVGISESVALSLAKAIPVAAGMAGGSADAAGALVACDALWSTGLDRAALSEIAATLGSDVPFPLAGGTALATGRGERIAPVLARGTFHWVFALADGGLSTPAVYAEFDRLSAGRLRHGPSSPEGVLAALRTGDPQALGKALVNDLQPAALRLRPALGRVLETGLELGAVGAVVSGSGPTCAFLTRGASDSVALAASLAGMGVCRAVRRAHGPVAGARVLT